MSAIVGTRERIFTAGRIAQEIAAETIRPAILRAAGGVLHATRIADPVAAKARLRAIRAIELVFSACGLADVIAAERTGRTRAIRGARLRFTALEIAHAVAANANGRRTAIFAIHRAFAALRLTDAIAAENVWRTRTTIGSAREWILTTIGFAGAISANAHRAAIERTTELVFAAVHVAKTIAAGAGRPAAIKRATELVFAAVDIAKTIAAEAGRPAAIETAADLVFTTIHIAKTIAAEAVGRARAAVRHARERILSAARIAYAITANARSATVDRATRFVFTTARVARGIAAFADRCPATAAISRRIGRHGEHIASAAAEERESQKNAGNPSKS